MSKSILEIMGFLGNILLVIAYFPQIYKTIKSKKADDISLVMWLIYFFGEILLLIYAIAQNDYVFITLLCIFCLGDIAIISLKLKYGNNKKHPIPHS